MIAVSDTSPLCYLILIGEGGLLPKLFGEVLVPEPVLTELLHEAAPDAVRKWASNLPPWVSVRPEPSLGDPGLERLQAGERAAILLAGHSKAGIILVDEKAARRAATDRCLREREGLSSWLPRSTASGRRTSAVRRRC